MTADQRACTRAVIEETPDAAVISNLGVASYHLIDVADRARNFYLTGAMGSTTPLGLGLATSTDEPVTVLDGDGSMLMSLGSLSTVADVDPPNLTVVVWENGRPHRYSSITEMKENDWAEVNLPFIPAHDLPAGTMPDADSFGSLIIPSDEVDEDSYLYANGEQMPLSDVRQSDTTSRTETTTKPATEDVEDQNSEDASGGSLLFD